MLILLYIYLDNDHVKNCANVEWLRLFMAVRFLNEVNEPTVAVAENGWLFAIFLLIYMYFIFLEYEKFVRVQIRHDQLCQNISEFSGVYEHIADRNKNKLYQKIGKPKKFLQWIKGGCSIRFF